MAVIDGRSLRRLDRRQGVITQLRQLAGRLRTLSGAHLPRMLVVSIMISANCRRSFGTG